MAQSLFTLHGVEASASQIDTTLSFPKWKVIMNLYFFPSLILLLIQLQDDWGTNKLQVSWQFFSLEVHCTFCILHLTWHFILLTVPFNRMQLNYTQHYLISRSLLLWNFFCPLNVWIKSGPQLLIQSAMLNLTAHIALCSYSKEM